MLAAGLSTRMGHPKLLVEIHGTPMLARVVEAALASRLDRVIVVVGPQTESLGDPLERFKGRERFCRAFNPDPGLGMSSSLKIGMSALTPQVLGAMIILGDQPWLSAPVIDGLIEVFRESPGNLVAPSVRGKRTTPVIFPADLFPELLFQSGDVGGRNVVNNHPDRVVQVTMDSWYDDTDVDTAEDLKRTLSQTRQP